MRLSVLPSLGITAAAVLTVALWPGAADTPPPAAGPAVKTAPVALQVMAWSAPSAEPGKPTPAGSAARPAPRPAGGVAELCGLGRMPLPGSEGATDTDADDAETAVARLPAPLGEQPLAQAREALLARLHQGDSRQRALALLLSRPADEAAARAWSAELLTLARHSGLPELLQWAEPACTQQGDPAACRRDLIHNRLRLEPDNAAHWAALADEDPSAGDIAWAGLQRASRWQERPQALLLATQAAVPPELPGYLRLALAREMQLRTQQLPSAGEGFVLERCQRSDTGRAACGQLAELMSQRSDTLRTLTEAASVAQAAGLPEARVNALRQEFHQLRQADPLAAPGAGAPLGCARLQAWQQHLDDSTRLGELGALRLRRAPL